MTAPARRCDRVVPVLLAAVVLVGGANAAAWAATGNPPVLLGHANKAARTTTLTSKKGPVLRLTTKDGSAPLSVSSSTVVAKLNADTVDGRSASDLGTTAYTYSIPDGTAATSHVVTFPGLPDGTYLTSYDVAARGVDTALTCYFRYRSTLSPTVPEVARSTAAAVDGLAAVQATGVQYVTAGPTKIQAQLNCESSSPFTFNPGDFPDAWSYGSTVTFVRVDEGSTQYGTSSVS